MVCSLYPSRDSDAPPGSGSWANENDTNKETGEEKAGAKTDLQVMQHAIDAVLNRSGLTDAVPELLQDLAAKNRQLFFAAGVVRLQLEDGPPGHRRRSLRLLDAPAFLLELVRSDVFSTREIKDFCARLIREDPLLDVKLAHLLPGRRSDSYQLETSIVLRVLDVLDEISPGPRLLMVIGHLTHHPERYIASKAALLIGRRLQSREWVERHLASVDSRVRANVVEALWSVNSALAARTFRKCLRDENNRVHGNALVGLHRSGDQSVGWRVRQLAKDSRPAFRQTAAWVIGMLQDPELAPLLEALLTDSDPGVGQSAANALKRWRVSAASNGEPDLGHGEHSVLLHVAIEVEAKSPETAAAGEPVSSVPEVILTTTGEGAPHEPGPDQQAPIKLQGQKPTSVKFNLHLDGRYVTGN